MSQENTEQQINLAARVERLVADLKEKDTASEQAFEQDVSEVELIARSFVPLYSLLGFKEKEGGKVIKTDVDINVVYGDYDNTDFSSFDLKAVILTSSGELKVVRYSGTVKTPDEYVGSYDWASWDAAHFASSKKNLKRKELSWREFMTQNRNSGLLSSSSLKEIFEDQLYSLENSNMNNKASNHQL